MFEKKTCTICGGQFKNLGVHMRKHETSTPASAVVETKGEEPSSASPYVKFLCTRAPQLAIIIKHGNRRVYQTERGTIQDIGETKVAQFVDGVLVTDDPDIIDYLTKQYKDPKFPVVNATAIGLR